VATLLAVAGCGGDESGEPVAEAAADAALPDFGLVTPAQAAQLAASGVTVIDVRTPEEFAEGHIEGAQLIDFYSDTFAQEIAALDPDEEYLVYCRSGNRSGQTIAFMQQQGIDQVWDLQGGVLAGGLSLVP
jgi:rhodanese-related sulfurtransferase